MNKRKSLISNFSKHWPRLVISLGLVTALAWATVRPALAVVEDHDGYVAADEVIDDDLIMSAQTVTMDGTVNGNLIATGGIIRINGTVKGDVLANGAQIFINGPVEGNVIIAGGNLEVTGPITGSLFAADYSLILGEAARIAGNVYQAGFSFDAQPGSFIARDAQTAGYQVLLGGEVGRNVNSDSAALEVRGKIGGDINAHVGEANNGAPPMGFGPNNSPIKPVHTVETGLRIFPSTEIGGALNYTSPAEQSDAIHIAPPGGVKFEKEVEKVNLNVQVSPTAIIYTWFFGVFQEFITLLVLGGLILWLTPTLAPKVCLQAQSKPLPALGSGFMALCGGFVLAGVAAGVLLVAGVMLFVVTLGALGKIVFTIGFSSLSLAFAVFWLLAFHVSKLVVAYLGGQYLLKQFAPQSAENRILALVIGVVIYVLVTNIPVLGWLIAFALMLIGLGAMWLAFKEWRATRTAAATLPPPPPAPVSEPSPVA